MLDEIGRGGAMEFINKPESELIGVSPVTEKVLRSWEHGGFIDNGVLRVVRENVVAVENRDKEKYVEAAKEMGWSVDELKTRLQHNVERLARNSGVFRMTSLDALNGLLNVQGRLLSQFETGSGNAVVDKRLRAFVEAKLFGFNAEGVDLGTLTEDQVTEQMIEDRADCRVIYGYLSDDNNGIVRQSDNSVIGNMEFYGDVAIKFRKDKIGSRTTVSFRDSLSKGIEVVPSPLEKPHFTCMGIPEGPVDGRPVLERVTDVGSTSEPGWGELYAEAQFHGQVTWEDVESIHVSHQEPDKVLVVREIVDRFRRGHPEAKIKLVVY